MSGLKTAALLALVAFVAGCPALFLPPGASAPPGEAATGVARAPGSVAGPLAGHYRMKLFGRAGTREFDLDMENAGRYVFGRVAPLNSDPPPGWTFDGEYSLSQSGEATMSIVLTLGSTHSAEPATTSIAIQAGFVLADLSLASPAPSPLPTPTPFPTPEPGAKGGVVAVPEPIKMPAGPASPVQAFVGTWSEGGQASGSVTGLKFSPR